jgi:GNAT superfamily N-acetyltransferase
MVAARKSTLSIRQAHTEDVARLARINRAAYPDLVEDGVVWSEAQLHLHLARFPEGQMVAELDGAPAGAVSTFIVPRKRDPMAQHSWREITDDGTFASHDPDGPTLYLADIYVDPAAWGRGVGPTLYAGLRDLCAHLGLWRIVAGGRLWGYHEYANRMWPEEYVQRVVDGELHDRVLSSQLRAGYRVRGILAEYLKDPRSHNYATLLEWRRGAT